jgi:N-acetylglucosaminyl-diphospho-decaprenol L-rhamnosyltransferase
MKRVGNGPDGVATYRPDQISAIVVTWNSAGPLRTLLEGLDNYCETIVVDNSSQDDSAGVAERFPGVKVVRNHENLGFGAACNQGAAFASGDVLVFLNPDVEISPVALQVLTLRLREPCVGAVLPRLSDSMAKVRETVGHEPSVLFELCQSSGLWKLYKALRIRPGKMVAVQWGFAACIALRRNTFDEIQGFDADIFLYGEDMDLCRRIRDCGKVVLLDTTIMAGHVGNHSGGQAFEDSDRIERVLQADYRFMTKFRSARYASRTLKLRTTTIALRALVRKDHRIALRALRERAWLPREERDGP